MPPHDRIDKRVTLSFDSTKIQSQLDQLSLEEKVALLSGSGFSSLPGCLRLGVPPIKVTEGFNGVKDPNLIDSGDSVGDVLAGLGPKTVVFPSSTCYGASWNTDLMYEVGVAIGHQAREKDVACIMGPGANLHRDARAGRNFEYFSEDPHLSGRLAAGLINGAQSCGVGTAIKHWYGNEAEDFRRAYNVVDPSGGRALRELYLAPFQETLRYSDPTFLMTSYNSVGGYHTSESPLIEQVVRKEWQFEGAVMSDWFGTVSTVPSINAGQDLDMPGPSIFRGKRLVQAVKEGKVSEDRINKSATKMLELTHKVTAPAPQPTMDQQQVIDIARRVAEEGVVLLKNENHALPINTASSIKVAVTGTPAVDPPIGGGGSSRAPPVHVRIPFDHIKASHSNPSSVVYAGGVRISNTLPAIPAELTKQSNGQPGIDVSYFSPESEEATHKEQLKTAQIMMLGQLKPGLKDTGFRYVMETTLTPEVDGKHSIGVRSTGKFTLTIDGTEVLSGEHPECNAEDVLFTPFKLEKSIQYPMKAHRPYKIQLTSHERRSKKLKPMEPSPHSSTICFRYEESPSEAIQKAVQTAKESEVSIIFAGRNEEFESEGFDLPDINLPCNQIELIREVAAVSKKTVLILHSGGPLDISPVVDSVDAILHAHYLGQEGGEAIANILSGKVNPSGKLATTWPKCLADTLTHKTFPAVRADDGTVNLILNEGLQVGYRRDWKDVRPRYLFGHGLSYTSFSFSDLNISPNHISDVNKGTTVKVQVTLKNTGSVSGAEVVQIYVTPDSTVALQSPIALRGFRKIFLEPGHSEIVELSLNVRRAMSSWDPAKSKWVVQKGRYRVNVGESDLKGDVVVECEDEWLGL